MPDGHRNEHPPTHTHLCQQPRRGAPHDGKLDCRQVSRRRVGACVFRVHPHPQPRSAQVLGPPVLAGKGCGGSREQLVGQGARAERSGM